MPDDDLIAANYVESLLRAITEHESVSMVRCGVKFVDSEGVVGGGKLDLPEIATIEDYILADVHGRLFQSLSGAMCPTELVKALGGFEKVGLPKELYSDHLFWLKVAANGSKVITVQECLYFYRIHCGHMGIGINLRDFADGTKLYVAKYKRVVRERGIDSNISHYLDNEFATSIMKTRLAVTMSRMLRGTVAYSRTTLLRDLKLYLRPKVFDIRLFLFAMVLLINRNLANAMLKIFHFLRERLLARRGRHG